MAPADRRGAARREALERWQRRAVESHQEFPSHVLLDQDGRLRDDELDRLISTRDDRPVSITE